jgi:hypothetical protein
MTFRSCLIRSPVTGRAVRRRTTFWSALARPVESAVFEKESSCKRRGHPCRSASIPATLIHECSTQGHCAPGSPALQKWPIRQDTEPGGDGRTLGARTNGLHGMACTRGPCANFVCNSWRSSETAGMPRFMSALPTLILIYFLLAVVAAILVEIARLPAQLTFALSDSRELPPSLSTDFHRH